MVLALQVKAKILNNKKAKALRKAIKEQTPEFSKDSRRQVYKKSKKVFKNTQENRNGPN